MEKELSSSSTKSDIGIISKETEEEEEEEENIYQEDSNLDKVSLWSSRFNCYKAYACSLPCFEALEMNWQILNAYGVLGFVPLIIMKIVVGIPVVIIQIMLGRYIMTSLSKSWSMHVTAKGILFCEIATTSCFIIQSLAITSYLLEYTMLSFSLPWRSCNESWATISCYEVQKFDKFLTECFRIHSEEFCNNLIWELSGKEYWKYVVSSHTNPMSLFFIILNLFLVSVILFAMVVKGIQSAEKCLGPLVISSLVLALFMAFIICVTPEFVAGFKPIFSFNLEELFHLKMWVIVYDTTIFTLGIGRLPLAFISSQTSFKYNIFNDVLVVCFIDIFFCLVTTLPPLCVMKTMNTTEYKVPLSDFLDFYISLSEMVLLFPFPNGLWSMLYFLLLSLISIGSLIVSMLALVQTVTGFAPDRFTNFYTSLFLCSFCFFCSVVILFYQFEFTVYFDRSIVSILFLYLLTLEVFYGFHMFNEDFHFMMGYPVPFFLKLAWIISLPISFIMIVFNAVIYDDDVAETQHYVFSGIPFLIYILTASLRVGIDVYHTKSIKGMPEICKPDPDWGPADPNFKKSRILFDSRAVTKEFMYRQELREKLFLKAPDISEQSIVHVI